MSFFSRITPSVFSQLAANNQAQAQQFSDLNTGIGKLNAGIQNLTDKMEKPFTFLNLNNQGVSANVAANTIIVAGIPVPNGYRGRVKDFNVNFTTSGGTIGYAILDYNGKNIIQIVTPNINSSSSGFGDTILDSNTCIGIIGTVQGAGIFTGYLSGEIVKIQ
ncbi:MAG: hypothetical protein KGI06_06140 [Candidatus Micrarchaeota archaeon]|nr:hypothetical protein [Candidatus Micrarchaeota archaeon]